MTGTLTAGEILDRHDCSFFLPHGASLPNLPPYASLALKSDEGPVQPTLMPAIESFRNGEHEVLDVYVRPRGAERFTPLRSQADLAVDGAWVLALRKRHPDNEPRVVGIMLAKDEADVIPEVVTSLSKTLDTLYFYVSDAATKDALIAASPSPSWARSAPNPPSDMKVVDGFRQTLLNCAREDARTDHDPRPLWVMVVQGDEIYADDLRLHIRLAQRECATVMTCQVATFLLHESQREGWDWGRPLAERLTHYIWDFGEHTGFLDFPWIYYNPAEHMRAHPHGTTLVSRYARARPVRRHYPFRTPEQATARIADRLTSGWQPHYANYSGVFVGDEAAGRQVKKFHGWFPEAERVDGGIW